MGGNERQPRTPHELCKVVTIQRVVSTGLLDDEPCASVRPVEIVDPLDPAGFDIEPMRALKSGGGAVISFDDVHVQAFGRRLGPGRRWWYFECPLCKGRCRNLYRPPPALAGRWACRKCNRVRFPSQTTGLRRAERAAPGERTLALLEGLDRDRCVLAARMERSRMVSGLGRLEYAREMDAHNRYRDILADIPAERGPAR